MSDESAGKKRQLGGELVIPVLGVAFTIYYFTTIWNSPWTAQVAAFLIGGILLLVCGMFVVRSVFLLKGGEASLGMGNLFSKDDIRTGRIGLFATTLGFCIFIDWIGFTLTTFLFLFLSMVILSKGEYWIRAFLASAALSLGGWAVFIWAFQTRFPRGWFEETMRMVLNNG